MNRGAGDQGSSMRKKSIQNVIKWTGTKRRLAQEIISSFPGGIRDYYEPFVGSGAVMRAYMERGPSLRRVIASDICAPLILLWKQIQKNPEALAREYAGFWKRLAKDPEEYYAIRAEFNGDQQNSGAFLFLLRTSVNGMVRFNSQGLFNAPLHVTRRGIVPLKMREILLDWSEAVQKVEFICQDYRSIMPGKADFCFMDPPYLRSKSLYYGSFCEKCFYSFLRGLKCRYAFTFDGLREDGGVPEIPADLYSRHILLNPLLSSYSQLNSEKVRFRESLYLGWDPSHAEGQGAGPAA